MKKIVLLMIIGILILSFHNLNVEIVLADPSNNYYVANDGNDSNNGTTPETAWKTIGKVNTELSGGVISQGDDIYFKRGDNFYGTQLTPLLGGTSSDPMVIGAYGTGAKPLLGHPTASGVALTPNAGGTGNYTLENLNISDCDKSAIAWGDYATSNIIIRKIDSYNCSSHGVVIAKVDTYKVENCNARNMGMSGVTVVGSSSDHATNGKIWNCTAGNVNRDGVCIHFGSSLADYVGSKIWVKNCTWWDIGEAGIDISPGNCLDSSIYVEDCTSYNCNQGGFGGGWDARNVTYANFYSHDNPGDGLIITFSENTIVRNSVIQNWGSGDNGVTIYGTAVDELVDGIAFYNNDVISDSIADLFQCSNSWTDDLIFKNNIMCSTASASPNRFVNYLGGTLSGTGSIWSNNIWWRGDGGAGDEDWWYEAGTYQNFSEWTINSEVSNEQRADPLLVDAVGGNFALQNSSPAINAGSWLTATDGSGSGTTITVLEANYFFDGYGMTSGDNIFIGDDANLEVTDVDYSAETITVNRSITWADGEDVSLSSYSGSAPDIGAREFVSSGPNTIPPEITNIIRTTSDPLDIDASFGWINITATVTGNSEVNTVMINVSCPNGSSSNASMNVIGSNTYYYNTSTIFSNHGDYSYYIWADDINGNQSTSTVYDFSMPPNWDINKDRQCTVLDLILLSNHYGETGQNGWIREDVDNNGVIQMPDFVLVSAHYYKTW